MTLSILLAVSLAQAAAAPAAPPRPFTVVTSAEGFTEYSLPNGMRVLFVPDASKPTATVNITYIVGSRHEGLGEKGMAHLLEHMLFKGTTKVKDAKIELTAHGADSNGTTWFDRTNYFETFPSSDENVKWAIGFEADRMVNSRVSKADLDSEMTVVRNEFEMGENQPEGVLMDRVLSTAYVWHNYGDSTIGPRSDIERVPVDKLQDFYRRYYQPDNALLIVAGKFDETKAFGWIAETFGKIAKPKRVLNPSYTVEPVQDGERAVTVRRVGGTPVFAAGYHVPAGSDPDFPAVMVLAEVLGDSPSGRLYQQLVETKKAASVGCEPFMLREPGYIMCIAQLGAKDAPDAARTALIDTIENLSKKPVDQAATDRARTSLLKHIELMLNSSARIGIQLSEYAAMGDWRLLFLQRDRLKQVTAEDVNRVAGKYFKQSNRTLGEYAPTERPDRAEVPEMPGVAAMLKDYKGSDAVAKGEAFDASPKNIDSRTTSSKLANGMQLALVQKKTRGETVHVVAVIRYGNEKSLTGLRTPAAFTARMLSRGTKKHTREQFQDELDKLNAKLDVQSQPNAVVMHLEARKPQLQAAMNLMAEALKEPAFDPKELESLRREAVTAAERDKSDPVRLGFQELQRNAAPFPKGHPYSIPSFEEVIAEANAVKLDALKDFHGRFYGAQNGQVAVVGDFDAAAVQSQLETLYGGWKAKEAYTHIPKPFKAISSEVKSLDTPDKENAFMGIAVTFPMKDSDTDYASMEIANYMLGGGFLTGRIPARLREKDGLSYGAATMFNAPAIDDGAMLMGYAIYAPQNVEKVEKGFREELDRAVKGGFTADELKLAKSGLLQEREQSRANDSELAIQLVRNMYLGRTMAFEDTIDGKLKSLSTAEVGTSLKKYLDPAKMVMIKAGDFKKVAAPK